MGLERIAAVLQGKHNNYDIDLFRTLIEAVAHETGVDPDGPQSASHKVIADHLRTTAFLIADGVLPSNEGRGYVLRRIMAAEPLPLVFACADVCRTWAECPRGRRLMARRAGSCKDKTRAELRDGPMLFRARYPTPSWPGLSPQVG